MTALAMLGLPLVGVIVKLVLCVLGWSEEGSPGICDIIDGSVMTGCLHGNHKCL